MARHPGRVALIGTSAAPYRRVARGPAGPGHLYRCVVNRSRATALALLALLPAIATANPAAAAAPAPAAPRQQVLVIGNSVVAGVAATGKLDDLQARLPGWDVTFDAHADRNTDIGVQLVSAAGPRRFQVVIVALGENDLLSTFPSEIKAMMGVVANVPRVYWLTVRESRRYAWLPKINAQIRQSAPAYSNLAVADWNRYGAAHPADFWGDGLHLDPTGGADMAAFLADLVNGTSQYARPFTAATVPPTTAPAPSRGAAVVSPAAGAQAARTAKTAKTARVGGPPSGVAAGLGQAVRVVLDAVLLLVLLAAAAIAISPACRRRRRLRRARLARLDRPIVRRLDQRTLAATSR
jgi:hypothetical protein